jgi:hypothetical protein
MSTVKPEPKPTKKVSFVLPEGHRSRSSSSSEQSVYIPKKLSRSSSRSTLYSRPQRGQDVYYISPFALSGLVLPTGIPDTKHMVINPEEECKCSIM